jgi:outer membrane protein assembly factor BamB
MLRTASPLLLVIALSTVTARADEAGDELLAAARKGDAEAVKRLLAKGADVNAKNAYGATALSFAADAGHVAVIKVLLQHKADVNLKDTFYKAAPLDWAVMRSHAEVVGALVQAGAAGADDALKSAAAAGRTAVVQAILDQAKLKEETLSKALAATPARHTAVAELLKKAGAKAATTAEVTVPPELLASYAGTYRTDRDLDIKIAVAGGKLTAQFGSGAASPLVATDKASFEMAGGSTLTFRRDKDKVNEATLKFGTTEMALRRVEAAAKTAPSAAKIEDKGGVVRAPLNWPSFRGPGATGVADGQFPPLTWDAATGANIRWKTPIPGLGHSCPVVWQDQLYVTTAVAADGKSVLRTGQYGDVDSVNEPSEHSWRLYAIDKRSGKIIWERTACQGVPKVKRHTKASHANPTPATDGTHVVVSFGSEGLYCYRTDGSLLWRKSLGVLDSGWFYNAEYQWGFGSSPIIHDNLVIVQCDIGKDSFLAAYQLDSGSEVWRKSREEIPSWGTPTIIAGPERVELVTAGSKFARGYDPRTGAELWRLGKHSEITVPTPFAGAGLIFLTSGYRPVQPIYAIRPGAKGDISLKDEETKNDAIAWSTAKGGPYMPTPIVYREHLYICSNSGMLTCFEAKTGKLVYKERLGDGGSYTASPVAADGHLYFPSEDGDVRVVKAGPKFESLAVNALGDACLATPAISDGMMFVRTQHHLFGIGRQEQPKR